MSTRRVMSYIISMARFALLAVFLLAGCGAHSKPARPVAAAPPDAAIPREPSRRASGAPPKRVEPVEGGDLYCEARGKTPALCRSRFPYLSLCDGYCYARPSSCPHYADCR